MASSFICALMVAAATIVAVYFLLGACKVSGEADDIADEILRRMQ